MSGVMQLYQFWGLGHTVSANIDVVGHHVSQLVEVFITPFPKYLSFSSLYIPCISLTFYEARVSTVVPTPNCLSTIWPGH